MTTEQTLIAAHKAGRTLAQTRAPRTHANEVARTLPVNEADALLAGYYAETRRMNADVRAEGWPSETTLRR